MPPNRRVNKPTPTRRRPKVAGTDRPRPEITAEAPAPQAATPRPVDLSKPAAGTGRTRLSWTLVAVLGIVAIALGAFAFVAYEKPGASVDNLAFVDNSDTQQVRAQVEAAVATLYTYDPAQMDGYPDTVRPLLTDKMRCFFDATLDSTKQFVAQTQAKSDIHVDAIGVSFLDDDRAEAIVSVTSSWSGPGQEPGSEQRQMVVSVEKSGDDWLVSDITDLREAPHSGDCPSSN